MRHQAVIPARRRKGKDQAKVQSHGERELPTDRRGRWVRWTLEVAVEFCDDWRSMALRRRSDLTPALGQEAATVRRSAKASPWRRNTKKVTPR
jgi:hypothetical protein